MGQLIRLERPAERPESFNRLIRFTVVSAALLLGLVLAAYLQRITPPPTSPGAGPLAFIIVDGDTIKSPAGVKYRLMGFDAPETSHAQCEEELQLALKAKARLEQLIASGTARLVVRARSEAF
jgi:endonuclease YncB( thermonuclease family)